MFFSNFFKILFKLPTVYFSGVSIKPNPLVSTFISDSVIIRTDNSKKFWNKLSFFSTTESVQRAFE